jgi:hypothetical protein
MINVSAQQYLLNGRSCLVLAGNTELPPPFSSVRLFLLLTCCDTGVDYGTVLALRSEPIEPREDSSKSL